MTGEPFAAVAPRFAEQGYRVLAVDPPHDGDALPSHLARRVLDLADRRVVFIGASWGAVIGLHLAAGQPHRVERLVLLDGGHVDVKVGRRLLKGLEPARRDAIRGVMQEPPSSAYARVTVPTLLVTAARNPAPEQLDRFRAALPAATVVTLDGGHDLLEDAPDETVSAVLDWLG